MVTVHDASTCLSDLEGGSETRTGYIGNELSMYTAMMPALDAAETSFASAEGAFYRGHTCARCNWWIASFGDANLELRL